MPSSWRLAACGQALLGTLFFLDWDIPDNSKLGELQPLQHPSCCHISGVRALTSAGLGDNKTVLVSGGGRSQIKAWLVYGGHHRSPLAEARTVAESSEGVVSSAEVSEQQYRIQPLCEYPLPLSQRERRLRRQQPPTSAAAESRVMALSALSVLDVASPLGTEVQNCRLEGVFVWAAYSDGWLR